MAAGEAQKSRRKIARDPNDKEKVSVRPSALPRERRRERGERERRGERGEREDLGEREALLLLLLPKGVSHWN